ncbi:hypothetical protein AA13595_2850 [Gluconacetobacter johannae DSM 13595]|nr:hypothetical protein AA13595_2850 [Gluconacetobacter johannae DSM 13595]
MAVRWLRAALALRPPFLPFGGLVLAVLAVCDAAPLLVGPLLLGLAPGCMRAGPGADRPGDGASAVRDRPAWVAVALLLAGMVVLTVVAMADGAGR